MQAAKDEAEEAQKRPWPQSLAKEHAPWSFELHWEGHGPKMAGKR